MKFDSILGTIWLDASPDALIGISYTPIDESPLANQEILQTAKKQSQQSLANPRSLSSRHWEKWQTGRVFRFE